MKPRLYSLCLLSDGVHWVLIQANGGIICCSPRGFATEAEALNDLQLYC